MTQLNKKYYLNLLAFICLIFCLAACSSEQTTQVLPAPTTPPVPADWKYRWLKSIPCAPPCWEGITPGQTPIKDVEAILSRSPIIQGTNAGLKISLYGPIFYTLDGQGDILTDDNGIVTRIRPHYRTPFKLSEISAIYGFPTHVLGDAYVGNYSGISYSVSFYYLSMGIELRNEKYAKDGSEKPMLSPDMSFDTVEFFTPPSKVSVANGLGRIQAWQGFKDFDFYCRARDSAGEKDCKGINFVKG